VFLQDNHEAATASGRAHASRGAICHIHLEAIMAIGTVKWFNPTKGFGFIVPNDGSKDVFVHISAVERAGLGSLTEGQKLSYDVVSERGKFAADNLKSA
jgi:CspA family cold shock protein